jgi:hypothetical protein
MTELQYFRLLAPEFASVADETVNQWLLVAGNLVNVDCLDTERAAMALALYAAHMLRLAQTQSSGVSAAMGAITSEKEGDLQRSYAGVKGSDTYLGQTSYGQQYLDITRACFGAAIMTRVE